MKLSRDVLQKEAIAGLPGAISSVPDGMAAAILAGVSPVQGLYASFVGPTAGGIVSSTRMMVITTTSAAALAAGSALSGLDSETRNRSIILLTLIAGILMIAAGIAKLGRYTRFVTQSVMIGFLTGVAANIVFGQLQDLVGYDAGRGDAIVRAARVLTHPGDWHVPSLLVGLSAIALLVILDRTPLGAFAAVIALVGPTVAVLAFSVEGVAKVSDIGAIPSGIPLPAMPHLSDLTVSLFIGALSVAAIVLVQGTGVAEAAPNLDGTPSDPNRDFIAQGAGNVAAGFFKGMPVGGSVGQTALNRSVGGRTRWAAIFSGLWMFVILAVFSTVVGKVAVPTLAAVLIVAGISSLRPREALAVWRTGMNSKVAMTTTFVATLTLPVAAAVGIGVALSLLLQLNREALDLTVKEVYFDEQGRAAERPAPAALPSGKVTVLTVYGSLYYAGARTLQARLPDPAGSHQAAVVLRLRGRTSLGATAYAVLQQYATKLSAVGGQLTLTGLEPGVLEELHRTGRFDLEGPVTLLPATEVLFESTEKGYKSAEAWIMSQPPAATEEEPS
ncbi:MAG: SulP family inorganic anion transporter [Ilumatobacteraceae bacterium]